MGQAADIQNAISGATNWALWKCDVASGDLTDENAGAHTLTAQGTGLGYSVAAMEGTGVSTPGTDNDFFGAAVTPLGATLPDNATIGFWVKGLPQTDKPLFVCNNGSGTGTCVITTGTSAGVDDHQFRIAIRDSAGALKGNVTVPVTVMDDDWHFIVVVFSGGSTVTSYVDGVKQLTSAFTSWSATTPTLIVAAVGASPSNDTATSASSEFAGSFDNVFAADTALSEQDVIDIYNAGAPGPPEPASATIPADGTYIDVTFIKGPAPLLPAAGVTGLTATRLGATIAMTSVARQSDRVIRMTPAAPIAPGPVLLSYSQAAGNLTDSTAGTPLEVEDFTDFAVTNNSVAETYCEITIKSSTSGRMAPHTVFVTLAASSVPINGDWRYCAATIDFGDGSTVTVTNPVTGRSVNARSGQTSWACAAHEYQSAGTYTITATLTGSDGVAASDTADVTIVADTRATKYADASASPGGDGSQGTPWASYAEMMAGLASEQRLMATGLFEVTAAVAFPAISNTRLEADGACEFRWTVNPATNVQMFDIPAGAENITFKGIKFDSDQPPTGNQTDNFGGITIAGNGVSFIDCDLGGMARDGTTSGLRTCLAISGGSGVFLLRTDIGDASRYCMVTDGASSYLCVLGGTIGAGIAEHSFRMVGPTNFTYAAFQWVSIDQRGLNAKNVLRFGWCDYATAHDCVLDRGALDFAYHGDLGVAGDYGRCAHVQVARTKISDTWAIAFRPNSSDVAIVNCYIKDAPVFWDINSEGAGDKVSEKISFLHNDFLDTTGGFRFIAADNLTNDSHAVPKSGIEVDGNLFASTSGETGDIVSVDDGEGWTIFSSFKRNVMRDGLSVYGRVIDNAGANNASLDWAAFTAEFPINDRETIEAADLAALTDLRPPRATYPTITSFGAQRDEGILQIDLMSNRRPSSATWYVGPVDRLRRGRPRWQKFFGVGMGPGLN